ncbi:MAG TPA: type II secretion system F family protein [Opitutaceae bacterium]|nr:type II secretion system F family protein [Opitutaceae bacterium]
MPRFDYTARTRAGAAVTDVLEAPSRRDALRMLTARGLQVGMINEQAGAGGRAGAKAGAKPKKRALLSSGRDLPPSRRDRLSFLQALFDLTTSGLSAGESVRLLSQRIKEPTLRTLCAGLWEKLSEGAPLSRAMAAYPQVFDSSTINLIQAGEATGSLNDTLSRLIEYFTEQRELRRQLVTALAYPVLMVFVAIGVIVFFLWFLLPKLQDLLTSLNSKLPPSTRVLITVSDFAIHYGLFIAGALVFLALSFWRWRATEAGRKATDAWLLKLPLLGEFIQAQTVLAFSQTLSVLLENGINASEALRMTERQIANLVHRDAFKTAIGRVMEGEALSLALTRTGCFPDLVLDRLAVGENTGNVVPSLKQVAQAYQKVISQRLGFFTQIIATTVLMSVFIFVGFIAFAIVQAVFQASQSMKS